MTRDQVVFAPSGHSVSASAPQRNAPASQPPGVDLRRLAGPSAAKTQHHLLRLGQARALADRGQHFPCVCERTRDLAERRDRRIPKLLVPRTPNLFGQRHHAVRARDEAPVLRRQEAASAVRCSCHTGVDSSFAPLVLNPVMARISTSRPCISLPTSRAAASPSRSWRRRSSHASPALLSTPPTRTPKSPKMAAVIGEVRDCPAALLPPGPHAAIALPRRSPKRREPRCHRGSRAELVSPRRNASPPGRARPSRAAPPQPACARRSPCWPRRGG
jgi:hypothetical protein